MNRTFLIRALSLYVPLLGSLILWNWRKPARAEGTGALLATAWNLPALLALNLAAQRLGWWKFGVHEAVFLGTPVDLWLGWSFLWGTFAALLFRRAPAWLACCCFGLLDLVLMPLCAPVVSLGRFWLAGELTGLIFCLLPALYFARWTRDRAHVERRAALQFLTFSGLFLIGILASYVWKAGSAAYLNGSSIYLQAMLQVLFVAAVPGLTAVQEFAQVGHGTPLPYDPPVRLVTSGIYSYIANPMQTSTALLLFALSLVLHSLPMLVAGLLAIVYSAGLAAWDEGKDLKHRFGTAFVTYRGHVRNWIPRWRPYAASPARIYLSQDCHKCSQMAEFLRSLKPHELRVLPAEEHPLYTLERMTYESGDGAIRAQGVGAMARALEHVNLAWAMAGFMLRLPVISPLIQSVADVSGGGPFRVARRSCSLPIAQHPGE